jgi:hypothetical protein
MLACKINKPRLNVVIFGSYTCYRQEQSRRATGRSGAAWRRRRIGRSGSADRDIIVVRQQPEHVPLNLWMSPMTPATKPPPSSSPTPPLVTAASHRSAAAPPMWFEPENVQLSTLSMHNKQQTNKQKLSISTTYTYDKFSMTNKFQYYISSLLGALMHQNQYWE